MQPFDKYARLEGVILATIEIAERDYKRVKSTACPFTFVKNRINEAIILYKRALKYVPPGQNESFHKGYMPRHLDIDAFKRSLMMVSIDKTE